jgi:hypothetical protein
MRYHLFAGAHPFTKLVFSLFIIISSFLAVFIISTLLTVPIFHYSVHQALNILAGKIDLENTALLKYLQITQSIGLFLSPPFIIKFFMYQDNPNYLKLKKIPRYTSLALVVLAIIIAIPSINFLADLNSRLELPHFLNGVQVKMQEMENNAQQMMNDFLKNTTYAGLLLNLMMIAVIPAIGEELLFRGVFQQLFVEWTKSQHAGILIAAAIFSAAHLQFFGFVPRFLLGAFFGYLLIWSRTMWLPIAAHFVNNATAVIYYFYYQRGLVHQDIDTLGADKGSQNILIISILFLIMLITVIRQYEKSNALSDR